MGLPPPPGNQDHFNRLIKGVTYWNSWRKDNPELKPDLGKFKFGNIDLSFADLSNVRLVESDFTGTNLNNANLLGAYLFASKFNQCYLDKTNFKSAELFQASFTRCNLSNTLMEGAELKSASFKESDLTNSCLREVNLRDSNFYNCLLHQANFRKADLRRITFENCDLTKSDFTQASLMAAKFYNSDLSQATFFKADLTDSILADITLYKANLRKAILQNTNLNRANLSEALLEGAMLIGTNLSGADFTNCRIHGISAWKLNLDGAKQNNLVITSSNEATITVDNIEVAQFIYLLLNNAKIRNVIDTITSKTVLILGRFTPSRKIILDSLRDELRRRNYLPIVFDFDKPRSRDLTETISTLAHMARFIVADITEAKSIPQELQAIIPQLPSVVVQPIIHSCDYEYGMFEHFRRYPWVLKLYRYDDSQQLLNSLTSHVIIPAENKVRELLR